MKKKRFFHFVFFSFFSFFFLVFNYSIFEDLTYSYYRLMMLFNAHTFLLD